MPLLGTALVLPTAAAAADLHVSPIPTGNCSSASLSCSLSTALAAAKSGDQILVHAGAYRITGQLADNATATDVQIMGAPGEARPVLDLSSGTLWLTHETSLTNLDVTTSSGTAVVITGGTIDRVRVGVSGAGATGVALGSGAWLRSSSVIATGTGATGVHVTAGSGRASILGSTLVASGSGAAAANVSPDSAGTQATLRAVNTIFNGAGGALDLRVASANGASATATLHHCATSPFRQSVIGDASSIDEADATVTSDPLFKDRGTGDLRQADRSPTIDAGTADVNSDGVVDGVDTALIGNTDFDGDQRALGTPDIGSDEHVLAPAILASSVVFDGAVASAQLTVQPNGEQTTVSADWSINSGAFSPTTTATVTGSTPVDITIPLGSVPAAARLLTARFQAINRVGTTRTDPLTADVPASALIGLLGGPASGGTGAAASGAGATASSGAAAAGLLPGALPTLLSTKASQFSGQFAFRLECQHSVSCRGSAVLTRVGGVRSATFKIPAQAVRTITFNLSSAQREHVRDRGKLGLRGLLHLTSNSGEESYAAVHLYPRVRSRATDRPANAEGAPTSR